MSFLRAFYYLVNVDLNFSFLCESQWHSWRRPWIDIGLLERQQRWGWGSGIPHPPRLLARPHSSLCGDRPPSSGVATNALLLFHLFGKKYDKLGGLIMRNSYVSALCATVGVAESLSKVYGHRIRVLSLILTALLRSTVHISR